MAETLGRITPIADAQTKAQERLALLRAGKGEPLTVCGQGSLYYLARDLTLAFTRSTRPVELKYEPETTDRLATLFLAGRHSVLLSWGPPIGTLGWPGLRGDARACWYGTEWAAGAAGPTGQPNPPRSTAAPGVAPSVAATAASSDPNLVPTPKPGSLAAQWQELERSGLKTYTIGAHVAAVIVNPKTGKTALTPNELRMILAGQVRDWRALGVPDGQLYI